MKPKMIRRQFQKQLQHNVRAIFGALCRLPLRERLVLAWQLARGDADLDRAKRRATK